MDNKTTDQQKDPMGRAIFDYYHTKKAAKLRVFSSMFYEDEIPVATLFRTFEEMPVQEQRAIELCRGRVLDVGAGSGCHSSILMERGHEVVAIDKDEAKQILAEFQSLLERAREDGGIETARTILQKAFGSKEADEVLEKTVPFKGSKPFEYLYEANSEKITVLLKDEPSHVRALVLSYLKPKIAAEFIQNLPEQEKKEASTAKMVIIAVVLVIIILIYFIKH